MNTANEGSRRRTGTHVRTPDTNGNWVRITETHWLCTYRKAVTSQRDNKESTFGLPQDIHTYLQQNRKCNSKYGGRIIHQAVTTASRINLHTMLPYHSTNLFAIQATVDSTKNNITMKRQYTKTYKKHQHLALTEDSTHPALLYLRNLEACLLVIPICHGPTVMSA